MIEMARNRHNPFSRQYPGSTENAGNLLIYMHLFFYGLLHLSPKMTVQRPKLPQRSYLQFKSIQVRIYVRGFYGR